MTPAAPLETLTVAAGALLFGILIGRTSIPVCGNQGAVPPFTDETQRELDMEAPLVVLKCGRARGHSGQHEDRGWLWGEHEQQGGEA